MTIYKKNRMYDEENTNLFYYCAHQFLDNGFVETCGIIANGEQEFCSYNNVMNRYKDISDLSKDFPGMEDATEEEFQKIKNKIRELEKEILNKKE